MIIKISNPFRTFLLLLLISVIPSRLFAQKEIFLPAQGGDTELWRITNDPSLRHWINYHNKQAFSYDGRYVCYVEYEPYDIAPERTLFVYDLHQDRVIEIGQGESPTWAKKHNWLFYVKKKQGNKSSSTASHVVRLDIENNKETLIAENIPSLGSTDFNDRWLYGYNRQRETGNVSYRIPIRDGSRPEVLHGLYGYQWSANPAYPVVFSRDGAKDEQGNDIPFGPTRIYCDLEGDNIAIGSPMLQRCHQSWRGDGEYLMHGGEGGTLIAGRKWNEPFPSNLHILANIHVGDISELGLSGRWVCGSANFYELEVADLRSGDGWAYLDNALSYMHDSYLYSYNDGSALMDNDSKGSADGTKIIFVTNYDLKEGPVTNTTESVDRDADIIRVVSTEGFAPSGYLSVRNEVVAYSRKTANSFEGLTRNMFRTTSRNLDGVDDESLEAFKNRKTDEAFIRKYSESVFEKAKAIIERSPTHIWQGMTITSFDARLIPEKVRKKKKMPSYFASDSFEGDKDSPLLWQNRTDVYIAVVRHPDQPHFNKTAEKEYELIPGENHHETYGYYLLKDEKRINDEPLRPGERIKIDKPGKYTAIAVEWSGLESNKSFPVKIEQPSGLIIRVDKPADFSWISERWLVNDRETDKNTALNTKTSVREIVHLVEGVIHREMYEWGQIHQRYDLNKNGKASRRLYYKNGKLSKREYYEKGENLVSRELFDENGEYIIESMQYENDNGQVIERNHFWYEKGWPVRFAGKGGWHADDQGHGIYRKEGDRWVKLMSIE